MTPTTFYLLLALIVVGAVLTILFIYRNRLKSFVFDVSKENATLKMETHNSADEQDALPRPADTPPTARLVIAGLKQTGNQNRQKITASAGEVRDLQQKGDGNLQEIKQPDSPER